MYENARQFFEEAKARIDPARTVGKRMSYRFDVEGAGTWRVDVNDGTVDVEERGGDADCVIRTSEETFLKIVNGRQSPMSAYMTGKVKVEGNMALAMQLRDLIGS